MSKSTEQLVANQKAAIESILTIANTSLATAERLAALNLNTARSFITDGAAGLTALLSVKDVQGFVAVQSALAKPAVEKSIAYSRSVYEIISESSTGLGQIVEGQRGEMKKNFVEAIEQSLKSAPNGSEPVVAAIRSAIAQADTAYETLAQQAQKAKATIEANVAAANAATVKLINQAA